MPKKRAVLKTRNKTYSLRCSSASIISVSLPEGVLDSLKEKHELSSLRKWAKAVLLRELIRESLIPFDLALGLGRRGFLRRDGFANSTEDSV